uniref:Uncharacterized protein n=1 Tax=Gopherus evgoodei TaxID=1825980 RepID=A0A8C4VTD2_9SAUR
MRAHTAALLVSLLVICHSVYAAILETNGSYKSCRCTKQTSDFISPRRYESIEIVPFGGACRTTEIIVIGALFITKVDTLMQDIPLHFSFHIIT